MMKAWEKRVHSMIASCAEAARAMMQDHSAVRVVYKEAIKGGAWGELGVVPEGSTIPEDYVATDCVITSAVPYDHFVTRIHAAAWISPIIGACDEKN